jgi:hypothetical protein
MGDTPADPRGSTREHENDNLKPGAPPRPTTEPEGGDNASRNRHTQTDPATGEPNGERE